MQSGLTVGDFSRVTHLSVKTLRHYHEVGLLEPAEVNPVNGYRYYAPDQIPTAQVILRLRNLAAVQRELVDGRLDPGCRAFLCYQRVSDRAKQGSLRRRLISQRGMHRDNGNTHDLLISASPK